MFSFIVYEIIQNNQNVEHPWLWVPESRSSKMEKCKTNLVLLRKIQQIFCVESHNCNSQCPTFLMSSSVSSLSPHLLSDLAPIVFLTKLYLYCSCYTPSSCYNILMLCFHLQKISISFDKLLLQWNEINLGKWIKKKLQELPLKIL